MDEHDFEYADGGKLNYPPFRPDQPCYPQRHEELPRQPRNDAKRPYIDFGTGRHDDKERYTSAEIMKLEWNRLWKKTWLICGHVSDLPKAGCYMKVDIGHESFIVIRQHDGSIKALYNVCQHRGTRLIVSDFGHVAKLTCPFHWWQYDLAGKCTKITDKETFRKQALDYDVDIPAVRVEEWKGWIFLTMNPAGPSLSAFLGESLMRDFDAYEWSKMTRVADLTQIWDVNWKAAREAFMESYHVRAVHPEVVNIVDNYHVQIDAYPNGHSRQIIPAMRPSPQSAGRLKNELGAEHAAFLGMAGIDPTTFKGRPSDVRPAIVESKRAYAQTLGFDFSRLDDEQLIDSWDLGLFPCTAWNSQAESVLLERFWPHPTDPGKVVYYVQLWTLPGAGQPGYFTLGGDKTRRSDDGILLRTYLEPQDTAPLGPLLSQDVALVPRIQMSMSSEGFRGALYSEQEVRIRCLYAEYYRCLSAE
jgi:phenylpropionate dioxygenase-like ring-hydroxylating dioxygenase large terminal subunit